VSIGTTCGPLNHCKEGKILHFCNFRGHLRPSNMDPRLRTYDLCNSYKALVILVSQYQKGTLQKRKEKKQILWIITFSAFVRVFSKIYRLILQTLWMRNKFVKYLTNFSFEYIDKFYCVICNLVICFPIKIIWKKNDTLYSSFLFNQNYIFHFTISSVFSSMYKP